MPLWTVCQSERQEVAGKQFNKQFVKLLLSGPLRIYFSEFVYSLDNCWLPQTRTQPGPLGSLLLFLLLLLLLLLGFHVQPLRVML